jgi:adenine phosphoribosyltransferase
MYQNLKNYVLEVENFPKPGVSFKDISPLLRNQFHETINALSSLIQWDGIDFIAGIESRGFIMASALAFKHQKGFIPIRKKGKLPPPVYSHSYQLEYGEDTLEISQSVPKGKMIIVDDVLATGGTYSAAHQLCTHAQLEVVCGLFLVNLSYLNKMNSEFKVKSLFEY